MFIHHFDPWLITLCDYLNLSSVLLHLIVLLGDQDQVLFFHGWFLLRPKSIASILAPFTIHMILFFGVIY